jgi:hypothetical protein
LAAATFAFCCCTQLHHVAANIGILLLPQLHPVAITYYCILLLHSTSYCCCTQLDTVAAHRCLLLLHTTAHCCCLLLHTVASHSCIWSLPTTAYCCCILLHVAAPYYFMASVCWPYIVLRGDTCEGQSGCSIVTRAEQNVICYLLLVTPRTADCCRLLMYSTALMHCISICCTAYYLSVLLNLQDVCN